MHTGIEGGSPRPAPRRGRSRWLVACAVLALVAATGAAAPSTGQASGSIPQGRATQPGGEGPGSRFACLAVGDAQAAAQYCTRYADDMARRRPLTPAQHADAARTAKVVGAAIARAGWCLPPQSPVCLERQERSLSRRSSSEDAAAVRQSLAAAGFPEAVVRVAQVHDPPRPAPSSTA